MPTNTEERPRVYLNKVHLKGYKSIEDVTIDFQKGLNILIGKNGAGKSNFLEMINSSIRYKRDEKINFKSAELVFITDDHRSFIFEVERRLPTRNEIDDDFDDRTNLLEKIIIDAKIVFDSSKNRLTRNSVVFEDRRIGYNGIIRFLHRVGYQAIAPLYIKFGLQVGLGCIDQAGELTVDTEDLFGFWDYPETMSFIKMMFFHFNNEDILDSGKSNQNLKVEDVLNYLSIPDNIIDNLKVYTPVEDVRFNNNINLYWDDTKLIIDNVKLEFKINGNWLPWSQLSDGTRRLFYIVAEITHTDGLILLEEPELGVHPHQFHLLMSFLKEQSEHKQIIISTHAPKALDHLSFDELNNILITYYDPGKGTQLKHLSDKEKAKAMAYANEVGFLSDYWLHSDLEE